MGVGVDVGVNPEGDARAHAFRPGHLVDDVQLRGRLHVEGEDIGLEAFADLLPGLADPREDDLARREASPQGPVELAAGHHVGARAQRREETQHPEVHVRLDRVAGEVGQVSEGALVGLVCRDDRARRVHEGGRPHGLGDGRELDPFAVKPPVLVGEAVHAPDSPRR